MNSEKIVVFEIDFGALKTCFTSTELTLGSQLFCRLGAHNHLFIFTNNSFSFALQFLREYNLPMGYLLANSGAIAYNLSSDLKIYENFLESGITQVIVKVAFINNLTCKIHSTDLTGNFKTFVFGLSYLNYQLKLIFKQYVQLTSGKEAVRVLKEHSIYSLEVLFQEKKPELEQIKLNAFLSNFLEFKELFDYFISSSTIYFFSPLNAKFNAIKAITQLSAEEIERNLIYSSLSFPDLQLALKAYFGLSFEDFAEFIESQFPANQVIYLEREQHYWLEGGDEHDYLWRENGMKIDWLSKKIKKIDFSKFKGKEKEFKNNSFELNLQTGILFTKILNEKERGGEPMQKKVSGEAREGVVDLYLWPEQLENLMKLNKQELCSS